MKWPLVSWILSSSSSSSSSSYSTSFSFSSQYNNDSSYDQTRENEDNEQQQSDDVSYKPENEMTGSASPSINESPSRKDISTSTNVIINSPPSKRRRLRNKRNFWTQEDELELLHGFLGYVKTIGHHQNDIVSFYDNVKLENFKHQFNKSQLVEKLRRLRRKYYNIASKINSGNEFSFRNPHEKGTFAISHKIWGSNGDRLVGFEHSSIVEEDNNIEVDQQSSKKDKKVKYCEENMEDIMIGFGERSNKGKKRVNLNDGSSLNKEEDDKSGMMLGLGFGGEGSTINKFGNENGEMGDEKWKKQQISELEVYSKRLELVQHQVKAALEELKSMGGSSS